MRVDARVVGVHTRGAGVDDGSRSMARVLEYFEVSNARTHGFDRTHRRAHE
jgi:hypothetical protein